MHFFERTFGHKWYIIFPFTFFFALFLAFLPSLIFWNEIRLNVPKFCEEWSKNILSLSIIFLILNYLNFQISVNRSRNKILLLIKSFKRVGDTVVGSLENKNSTKGELLNLAEILEKLLRKIQDEDEFLYVITTESTLSTHQSFFIKLKNYINASKISASEISTIRQELKDINEYIDKYT